jgi:hypothetical protein
MNTENFLSLIGLITPLLVGYLSKASWSGSVKFAIALAFSLFVAIVQVVLRGSFDFGNFAVALSTTLTIHQISYEFITKHFSEILLHNYGVKDDPLDKLREL